MSTSGEILSRQKRRRRTLDQSNLACDGNRGVRMIAGNHDDLDPCVAAAADRSGHFRSRRILETDERRQDQILPASVRTASRRKSPIRKGHTRNPRSAMSVAALAKA